MNTSLPNLLCFLNIFKLNLYILAISFVLINIFYFVVTKYTAQRNYYAYYFKIYNLIVLLLSFSFFVYYVFITYEYKQIILNNFIYEDETAFLFKTYYFLDVSNLVILYLGYMIAFISIFALSDRFWIFNYFTSVFFIYFLIIINLLAQSTNILELFIYYELLMLPSIFLVNFLGYTRKVNQSNIYFFVWTQLGSFLSLFGIMYLKYVCPNLDFITIQNYKFSELETYFLYLTFFFGFGIKVPVWPFHFWLIKVHVEAPSGFSIFLSGFLVKTAVYCFYKITFFFSLDKIYFIPVIFCTCGMVYSSLKMWVQTDLKKLIAYATVLEMNAIFFLLNLNLPSATHSCLIFMAAHGLLSTLMFYIVDCIYKRYNTRSLYKLYGISTLFPSLSNGIWAMLLLFLGIPGTLKFFVEFKLIYLLNNYSIVYALFFLFFFLFVSSIGFLKCWFSALYGNPGYPKNKKDLSKEEFNIIFGLFFLSIILSFFMFYM